jgi:hypothetical protein
LLILAAGKATTWVSGEVNAGFALLAAAVGFLALQAAKASTTMINMPMFLTMV